jgi:hypothetical protein
MPLIKILFLNLIKIYMNASCELGHELDEFSRSDVRFFVKIRKIRVPFYYTNFILKKA